MIGLILDHANSISSVMLEMKIDQREATFTSVIVSVYFSPFIAEVSSESLGRLTEVGGSFFRA